MSINKLTQLQHILGNANLNRNYYDISETILQYGVNLDNIIKSKLSSASVEDPLTVVDLCCGSGTAAESLAAFPEQVYRDSSSPLDLDFFRKINVIGIDVNPLPDMINKQVFLFNNEKRRMLASSYLIEKGYSQRDKNGLISDTHAHWDRVNEISSSFPSRFSRLVSSDACHLPLKDNSVDVLYSVAGMIYIGDGLKLLEETYRILKQGGFAAFTVSAGTSGISLSPDFEDILKSTQNGVFKIYKLSEEIKHYYGRYDIPTDNLDSSVLVTISKSSEDAFSGSFPYKYVSSQRLMPDENIINEFQKYYVGGVYGEYYV